MFRIAFLLCLVSWLGCPGLEASTLPQPEGDIVPTHDPVLIRQGDYYYSYATGQGDRLPLVARRSRDLVHWNKLPGPIEKLPQWASQLIPGAHGAWAPDISYVNGRYRLYYSVSTFGSRKSVIGLATASTLNPDDPDYGWRDEGLVISSSEADDYNAIDPNFVIDGQGRNWLAFGSFWGGLKLVELDPATGKPKSVDLIPIARSTQPQGWAIEAPFIFWQQDWYWLIASAGYCCRGSDSTYHLIIGRAKDIEGPYVDREGKPMLTGGGSILLQADAEGLDRWRGPGHAGYLLGPDGADFLIYHAYDRLDKGKSTLRTAILDWNSDGWPQIEK